MKIRNDNDPLEIKDQGITVPSGIFEDAGWSDDLYAHIKEGRLLLLGGDGNPVPLENIQPDSHIHLWCDLLDPPPLSGMQLFHVQERRDSGKHGGTFTAGARRTRALNTIVTNEIPAAELLSKDRIVLPAGKYRAYILAPVVDTKETRTWLRNVDAAEDVLIGLNHSADDPKTSVHCVVKGCFTLEKTSTLTVEQRCRASQRDYGFGLASSMGIEIYTDVEIWKMP